jgi:hypothetical protein
MRVMRKLPVVPICRMRAALSKDPNQQHICAVPLSQKGALRDRHERRKRDAMDAAARATSAAEADGEVVWSWRPWAGVKFANDDLQTTVTKKSWTPRRARSSVNTIAQGMSMFRLDLW